MYDQALSTEKQKNYLEAAKMYSSLAGMLGSMAQNEPAAGDLYRASVVGMARCANNAKQYDQAIDILEKQVGVTREFPAEARDNLAFAYAAKAIQCCSVSKKSVGYPCSKQQTDNMESWIHPAEELEPENNMVVTMLRDNRRSITQARGLSFHVERRGMLFFAFVLLGLSLFSHFLLTTPALTQQVFQILGEYGETFSAGLGYLNSPASQVGPLIGGIPYTLINPLWFGSGIALYLLGSLTRGYRKNAHGTASRRGFFMGLIVLAFLPVAALFRLFRKK